MTIFNRFAKYAIVYKYIDICDLFNKFVSILSAEEQKFASKNFMLMLKAGESARQAPEQIKAILTK